MRGLVLAFALAACTAVPPSPPSETPRVTTGLDERVIVALRFIDAYNSGRLEDAMSLVDDDVIGSDCDYRTSSAFGFRGRAAFRRWLEARIADHDRLLGATTDSSGDAIAVGFARRWSDTLWSLGFSQGIEPKLATKVAVRDGGIYVFANASPAGDPPFCRP